MWTNWFKESIRLSGMDHVRTSPFYPQRNGKIERWHQSVKGESLRSRSPLSLQEARQLVADFVQHHNTRRLHSPVGCVTPLDRLEGRQQQISARRDHKLKAARQKRQANRLAAAATKAENPKIRKMSVDTNSTNHHTVSVQ